MEKIPLIHVDDGRIGRIPPPVLSPIDRLPPPVVEQVAPPVVNGIAPPVVDVPVPRLEYPVIQMPPSMPSVGAPQKQTPAEQSKQPAKPTPPARPALPPAATQPPQPRVDVPALPQQPVRNTITVFNHEVDVPTPKEVVQAGVTAVIGTSVTLATAMVFNQARRIVGETAAKAVKNKFKIKLRQVKPVLHFIRDEDGTVEVIEYSSDGVQLKAKSIERPEQYLRDLIEQDEFFEADHRIVIDEPVRELFTKEGAKRFNYFAPPRKMARRLAARLTFG